MKRFLARALAAATLLLAPVAASAAIDFTVDPGGSSVEFDRDGSRCVFSRCGVSADLADSVSGTSFTLAEAGDSATFDFLTFTGRGTGSAGYDIVATLAFDPPSFSTRSDGSANALLLFGRIVGGSLSWEDVPAFVTLADGSVVSVDFQDGFGLFLGSSVTTSATVTLVSVAAVPLPGSIGLLAAAFGGVLILSRRRRLSVG